MATDATPEQPGPSPATTAEQPSAAALVLGDQLARPPLVPDAILKRHHALIPTDTRFRAAARLLQCLWREDAGLAPGSRPFVAKDGDKAASRKLGSRLRPDAAQAGRNFVTPEVHALVRRELALREEGAAIDEERLFGNALSSMPLTFNLLGPAALDAPGLGTRLFRRLLPEFVASVHAIAFETSPGRQDGRFLGDGTAFDAALHVTTPAGQPATVFIEVKYSERMLGPAAKYRPRYGQASSEVRLYRDPDSPFLRSLALEQYWREHMLAQLAVDHGATPRAHFVAIGPRLNRRVTAAGHCYAAELIDPAPDGSGDRVGFSTLTLEAVIAALAGAGAPDLARALWQRYCAFDRVLRAALGDDGHTPGPATPSKPLLLTGPAQADDGGAAEGKPLAGAEGGSSPLPIPRRSPPKREASRVTGTRTTRATPRRPSPGARTTRTAQKEEGQ